MKVADLERFVPEPPPEPPVCAACKTFSPEVLLPHGEGAIRLCWLCAHHICDHGVLLHNAKEGKCTCTSSEIYPKSYFERPLQ